MTLAVGPCTLVTPGDLAAWDAYHDIRRRVLFENRGRIGVYDASHPDDRRPGNFPKVMVHDGRYVGVVRIDIVSGVAHLRRVAIDEPYQQQGFGRRLLALAEHFASERGAGRVESAVAADAVPFYGKCGYKLIAPARPDLASMSMYKDLATHALTRVE